MRRDVGLRCGRPVRSTASPSSSRRFGFAAIAALLAVSAVESAAWANPGEETSTETDAPYVDDVAPLVDLVAPTGAAVGSFEHPGITARFSQVPGASTGVQSPSSHSSALSVRESVPLLPVKVGVIDFFNGGVLQRQFNDGLLPGYSPQRTRCFAAAYGGCVFGQFASPHGNAMTEVINRNAPGVQLYLAEATDLADYYAAADWFAANGVTIVNHSLVGVYDSAGDGTGPSAEVVDYFVSKGMAFFTSAGDGVGGPGYGFLGGYWRGAYNDPDGDRWLNFSGGDEHLATLCGALMGVRWSDWGWPRTDYALYAADLDYSTGRHGSTVLVSDNSQLAGAAPLEANDFTWLCNDDPADGPVFDKNGDGFVSLLIRRNSASPASSAVGDIIELQMTNGWIEHATMGGSSAIAFADSRNLGMAAVATDVGWLRGPTNDGRIKPDLVGPQCVATSVYGPCTTDDATAEWATATASGMAAMVQLNFGPLQPFQVVQYLRNAAMAGESLPPYRPTETHPNNLRGSGALSLPASFGPMESAQFSEYRPLSRRLLDTREVSINRPKVQAMPPFSSVTLAADSWPEVRPGESVVLNVTAVDTLWPGFVQVSPSGWSYPSQASSLNVDRPGQIVANLVVVPVGNLGRVDFYNTAGGHLVVDLVGVFTTSNGLGFNVLEPFRVVDTRCGGCQPHAGRTYRDIQVAGIGNSDGFKASVPPNTRAVMVSITVDDPIDQGFASVLPTSAPLPPGTSTTNYVAGRSSSGLSIVQVDEQGRVRVYLHGTSHFQLDIVGYFDEFAGARFKPVTPARMIDTRELGPRPPSGSTSVVAIADRAGVPADASAVIANLTVTETGAPGRVQIGADSTTLGGAYTNIAVSGAGQTMAVASVTRLSGGQAVVRATGETDRIVDVSGWFEKALDPLTVVPAPLSSVEATGNGGGAIGSASHEFVAFVEGLADGTARLVVWNTVTGARTVVPGPMRTDGYLLAVSDDGTKVAVNVFPGERPDHLMPYDLGIVDVATGSFRIANRGVADEILPWGPLNASLTETAFVSLDNLLPADTHAGGDIYRQNLQTGALTYVDDLPLIGPDAEYTPLVTGSRDLSVLYIEYLTTWDKVWKAGVGMIDIGGSEITVSPDGRHVAYVDYGDSPLDGRVRNLATGVTNDVCLHLVTIAYVDWTWSEPPSVPGTCDGLSWSAVFWGSKSLDVGRDQYGRPVTVDILSVANGTALVRTESPTYAPGTQPRYWVYLVSLV
jgi:hypothetical protein